MSNLEQVIEVIEQAIFDYFPERDDSGKCIDKEDEEINEKINIFLSAAVNSYCLVGWPESQQFMEEEWFQDEAILALGSEDITGSSAYFIPIHRIL